MTLSLGSPLRRAVLGTALTVFAISPFIAQTSLADSHDTGVAAGHHPKAQALRNKGMDFEFKGDTSRVVRFYDGLSYYNGQGITYGARRGLAIDDFRRRNAFPAPTPVAPAPPTAVE